MGNRINLIIVDDNPVFLDSLESLLQRQNYYNLIAKFTSGKELVEYAGLIKARVVLMDIEMPDMNGIETARIVNFMFPHIHLIAITMYQDMLYLQELIKAGYKGVVNKSELTEKLYPVIDNVMSNRLVFPRNLKI